MAFTFQVSNAVAQAMLNAFGAQIDAGTAAVFQIRSGAQPVDVEATATGTLLAELVCSATAFASVTDTNPGARATFAAIASDASADNTGTAGHFRLLTQSGGTAVAQGSVGTSGADLNLNTTSITAGSQVSITSATIDQPEG